jgi:hypothetical protein
MSRYGNSFEFFKEAAESNPELAEGYVIATADFIENLKVILAAKLPNSVAISEIESFIGNRIRFIQKAKKVIPE